VVHKSKFKARIRRKYKNLDVGAAKLGVVGVVAAPQQQQGARLSSRGHAQARQLRGDGVVQRGSRRQRGGHRGVAEPRLRCLPKNFGPVI
jgi:hypothetical protein